MVKLTVINMRDNIFKYVMITLLTVFYIFFFSTNVCKYVFNIDTLKLTISNNMPIYKVDNTSTLLSKLFNILKNEIYIFNLDEKWNICNDVNDKFKQDDINNKEETKAKTNANVITNLKIQDIDNKKYSINNDVNRINMRNSTSYNIDINDMLKEKLHICTDKEKLTILIVHTHGSESYTGIEHTDYFRNEDISKNMIRIGDELESVLVNSGYNVIHDKQLYDYPTYSGSYTRTLESINKYIDHNPNIDMVLDIHRDAISSKPDFAPITNINNCDLSKIMFVVGTAEGGLEHPQWQENLKLALKIQNAGEQMYPGIFREMVLTKSRYNQHTTKGSLILEVGATGNTIDQSILSMRYFAKILNVVLENE